MFKDEYGDADDYEDTARFLGEQYLERQIIEEMREKELHPYE